MINEAPDIVGLSDMEAVERDCYIYRSYIAMGSYEVIGRAASPLKAAVGESGTDSGTDNPVCARSS